MKQLFLLVFCTISVLFVDAQSQTISGTLLPKKGESVMYLPKATETQKSNSNKTEPKQKDTITNKTIVKKVLRTGNEKPVVKTKVPAAKVPFDSKGFIFSLPVVQGKNNTPVTPLVVEEPKPTTVTVAKPEVTTVVKLQTVASNSVPPTIKKTDNEPLIYEEPPTGSASWSAPPKGTSPAKLEPLVYGPPPVENVSTATNNTASDKKASLRSPKFKGVYKPTLKKPILLVPMSPDDMEDGVPKKKETEPSATVVEKPKPIEDLYPPLNYTVPTPASAANLRSPKIEGAYVASKNKSMVLMPVAQNPTSGQQQNSNTLLYQEPPVQTPVNNNDNSVNTNRGEQVSSSEPNIFDENYRPKPSITSKPIYTKNKNVTPKATTAKYAKKPAYKTIYKPVYKPVKQPVTTKPVTNFKKTFSKPVKQTMD